MKELFDKGHKIYPSPYLLDVIQDKLKQKDVLYKGGIPVPRDQKVESSMCLAKFGFPLVQKARKGGHDGRGVVLISDKGDVDKALKVERLVEELSEFAKEC
ncbi:5-(carboxyamino)imidazole ribonucleotide synthase, partial [Candidatus Hakubella thermalkaliphila]